MAKIVYAMDHLNFGDESIRTGWYLMRITLGCNAAGQPRSVVDRKPIAQLIGGSVEQQSTIIDFDDDLRAGTFQMMPRDWLIKDVK